MRIFQVRQRYGCNSLLAACILVASFLLLSTSCASADEAKQTPLNAIFNLEPVHIGGFVDTYYGHSFNDFRPRTRDYLTQAGRDREPNVNLAYLEAKWDTGIFRGRVAGQSGTSVDLNYAGEPEYGWRYLQEAWAGYRMSEKLWLDVGVYASHIGMESFISKNNWTYTRHLVSEYSPYYESGAKLTYQQTDELSLQLHVLNGWQNFTDFGDKQHPALGTQVAYAEKDGISVSYNTFLGAQSEGVRFYNDFVVTKPLTNWLDVGATFDIGIQQRDSSHPNAQDEWYTYALVSRFHLSDDLKAVVRAEQFFDEENALVTTINGKSFVVSGFSTGVDYQLHPGLWWRSEYRALFARDAIFRTEGSGRTKDTEQFLITFA